MAARTRQSLIAALLMWAISGTLLPATTPAAACGCESHSDLTAAATGALPTPTALALPAAGLTSMASSGSVVIDGGAASTSDPTLHLSLSDDALGTSPRMRFSIDDSASWTPWQSFATTADLALPAKHPWGALDLVVQFTDESGTLSSASAGINYVEATASSMALAPRYVLRASLDYTLARLTATEIVDITNRSSQPIGHLDFSILAHHFGEMAIRTVTVDGQQVSVSYPNDADLRVPLGFNLRPGESAQASISFTDYASSDVSTSLTARLSKANGVMQISSWHPVLSNGHGLRYPGDSQYSAAASYRLELNHPSNLTVAAPGSLVASSTRNKVFTLANAREFSFAASPSFARTSATTSTGVRVSVYYLPGTVGSASARDTATVAIQRYSAKLGSYPYSRYVIAQSTRPTSGNEYSGIVFVGSAALRNEAVIAHETAHQWWYGIVGDDQMVEPWLDEAFAEFSARYFFGRGMPGYCSSRLVGSSIYDFPNTPAPLTSTDCGSYDQTVYFKGAAFLNSVRVRMGTPGFMTSLRAMVSENRHKVVNTAIARRTFLRFAADPVSLDAYMKAILG